MGLVKLKMSFTRAVAPILQYNSIDLHKVTSNLIKKRGRQIHVADGFCTQKKNKNQWICLNAFCYKKEETISM